MNIVHIKAQRPYDVCIGAGLLGNAATALQTVGQFQKIVVVTDSNVQKHCLAPLRDTLTQAGYKVLPFIFAAGEDSKSLVVLEQLYSFMAENDVSKSDLLLALGGGVVGDLAGFAAATYLRGLPFVQIPTTLLAAVDSSVGGKTGVNLSQGKNLVGAFHQPLLVLCDTALLDTLPQAFWDDGAAEAIKYGVIWDKELFSLLAAGGLRMHLEQVIARCVEIKGELVAQDEWDAGQRMLLNFGHTIGHAIEAHSLHSVSHGRAVAMGMLAISQLAPLLDAACTDISTELTACLRVYHLPLACPCPLQELLPFIAHDKKRRGSAICMVLPQKIGSAFVKAVELNQFSKMIFPTL